MDYNFLAKLGLCLICGFMIGLEREIKGKPSGIGTLSLVIGGSMLFAVMSSKVGGINDQSRIAAQIVSGIGFLGAGIILRSEKHNTVTNLTTAAMIWYAASIGIAIGFDYYFIAISASLFAIIISSIPHFNPTEKKFDIGPPKPTRRVRKRK